MYRVSNFFKSLSLVLVVVFVASFASQAHATPPNTLNNFENQLNSFEFRLNKVIDNYGTVSSLLSCPYGNPNVLANRIDKLDRGIDRLGGILIGLQVKGNRLNNSEINMGLSEIANNLTALRCACNNVMSAAATGNLSPQQLSPFPATFTDIFRVINDCLRREIQIIRGNS